MANYGNMWEILKECDLSFDPTLIVHVKCSICDGVLVDAYEGLCGCNYCRNCVEVYLKKGRKFCPSDECKLQEISLQNDVVKSNSSDKKVSKLRVKCPIVSCDFHCELIKMFDHFNDFHKQLITCPYSQIGCLRIEMKSEKMTNHLLADQLQHSSLLVDSIMSLKHEMAFLAINKQTLSDNELNKLIELIDSKLIQTINYGTEQSKKNQKLFDEMQLELVNLQNSNKELLNLITKIKDDCDKKMKDCRENQEMVIKSIQESFQYELMKMQTEFQNSNKQSDTCEKNKLDEVLDYSTSKSSFDSFSSSKDCVKNIAFFKWNIADIFRIKTKTSTFASEFFSSTNKEYQMWLNLYPKGYLDVDNFSVEFRIKNGTGKTKARWPLKCAITILIKSKTNSSAQQVISKLCDFEEPKYYWGSEFFYYLYSDLDRLGVLCNKSIIIECFVDINK